MNQQNIFSHLTAKERYSLSFPAKFLLSNKMLSGKVLDFGCGYGKDVELLKTSGIDIHGYDKYYFPEYPKEKYDTILCFYVLNVLLPEEQASVLMEISELLKPSGRAFIAVRRDLRFEGFRTHNVHQKKTYQCNVVLKSRSVFLNENCEIYEYRHYNQLEKKGAINDCVFCNPSNESELIVESATAFSVLDKFPVNTGHALIIPKRHTANYFDLSFKEQSACFFMLNRVRQILTNRYNPDGFNVGININKAAGQTVPHVHIHLIPRYEGDVKEPRGGVRGVIPEKRSY